VRLKNETEISVATYLARINIQLLKASDFNKKLHEHGCPKKLTVQKICEVAKDEEVRERHHTTIFLFLEHASLLLASENRLRMITKNLMALLESEFYEDS